MAIILSREDSLNFRCDVCDQRWQAAKWVGGDRFLQHRYVHCPRCGHKSLVSSEVDHDPKLGPESGPV